jgi:hypothetical protein
MPTSFRISFQFRKTRTDKKHTLVTKNEVKVFSALRVKNCQQFTWSWGCPNVSHQLTTGINAQNARKPTGCRRNASLVRTMAEIENTTNPPNTKMFPTPTRKRITSTRIDTSMRRRTHLDIPLPGNNARSSNARSSRFILLRSLVIFTTIASL